MDIVGYAGTIELCWDEKRDTKDYGLVIEELEARVEQLEEQLAICHRTLVSAQNAANRAGNLKEEAQREGLRLVGLLRERDDTLAAVREWAEHRVSAPITPEITQSPQVLTRTEFIVAGQEVLAILNRSDTDE